MVVLDRRIGGTRLVWLFMLALMVIIPGGSLVFTSCFTRQTE